MKCEYCKKEIESPNDLEKCMELCSKCIWEVYGDEIKEMKSLTD